jgi:hypothetical protein
MNKIIQSAYAALCLLCAVPAAAETLQKIPGGEITRAGKISAWLIDPTTRYDHGALGNAITAGGFATEESGKTTLYRLPPTTVFEDRRVRLVDLDGDGRPEALIVTSSFDKGSALAVYRLDKGNITPLAQSSAIGQKNRWLNPIGVADFATSGTPVIAAIITPHLAGSLRLYKMQGASLQEMARLDGFTNHINGTSNLDLARIDRLANGDAPAIIIPTLDRRALAAITFQNGGLKVLCQKQAHGQIVELLSSKAGIAQIVLQSGARETLDLGNCKNPR